MKRTNRRDAENVTRQFLRKELKEMKKVRNEMTSRLENRRNIEQKRIENNNSVLSRQKKSKTNVFLGKWSSQIDLIPHHLL